MENDTRENSSGDLLGHARDMMGQVTGDAGNEQSEDTYNIPAGVRGSRKLATERGDGYSQGSMGEGDRDRDSGQSTGVDEDISSKGETDLARGYTDQTSIGDNELNVGGGYARGMLDDVEEQHGDRD